MFKRITKEDILGRNGMLLFYTGLLCWLAIVYAIEQETTNTIVGKAEPALFVWKRFFSAIALLAPLLAPLAIFSWYRKELKNKYSLSRYRLLWIACFVIYLPALAFIFTAMYPGHPVSGSIFLVAVCCLVLELSLLADNYYRTTMRQLAWIRQISLEKAVLLSITLMAIAWGIMAVSSWGDPEFHHQDGLLLGAVFRPQKILMHFDLFLGLTAQFLLLNLCGYFFFYLNLRWLVPRVLKQKGVVYYVLSVLATVAICYPVLGQFLLLLPINDILGGVFPENPFRLESAFAAMAIIFISLPVVLAAQWARQNSQIMALEKEKTQTELDLLKQQLNPHFFFNTLNNLYALSLQQSKETPDSILRLSELMRYVIYKAKEPGVKIEEEVKYLQDYIQLQQMRLKNKPDIEFAYDLGKDTPAIAPLLLIIFVENAFKHGVEPAEHRAFLRLQLKTDASRLFFSCHNSVENAANNDTGIGLANLKRRLSLLYPGKYVLRTAEENHIFKAELELDLT